MTDRKRSTASLAAMGMSTDELEAVRRWEVGLVAVPTAVALVWLTVLASTRITRPWLHRATSPDNLRTP